jgi:hypothetical protein
MERNPAINALLEKIKDDMEVCKNSVNFFSFEQSNIQLLPEPSVGQYLINKLTDHLRDILNLMNMIPEYDQNKNDQINSRSVIAFVTLASILSSYIGLNLRMLQDDDQRKIVIKSINETTQVMVNIINTMIELLQ